MFYSDSSKKQYEETERRGGEGPVCLSVSAPQSLVGGQYASDRGEIICQGDVPHSATCLRPRSTFSLFLYYGRKSNQKIHGWAFFSFFLLGMLTSQGMCSQLFMFSPQQL